MTIQEAIYDFKIKSDKVDTLQKRNFSLAEIDWLLGEAQWVWLKTNYGLTNKTKTGFEGTEHRIQDLKNLHIKSPTDIQPSLIPKDLGNGVYEVDTAILSFEHLFTTRARAKITKNNCSKFANITVTQTDDLNSALVDPFNSPNFNFGTVLGVYGKSTSGNVTSVNLNGSGSLFLYTDGTFTIDLVDIDYIKYPNRVWSGTYDITSDLKPKDVNNTYVYQAGVDTPVHFETNAHTHNEIVDFAVSLASQYVENSTSYQLAQQRAQLNK